MSDVSEERTCTIKKGVAIDAYVRAEFPILRGSSTPEEHARHLHHARKEFEAFLRDHRSQDWIRLSVEIVKQDQCSECGREWDAAEDGDGTIYCTSCDAHLASRIPQHTEETT